jgi:hypothetical protein
MMNLRNEQEETNNRPTSSSNSSLMRNTVIAHPLAYQSDTDTYVGEAGDGMVILVEGRAFREAVSDLASAWRAECRIDRDSQDCDTAFHLYEQAAEQQWLSADEWVPCVGRSLGVHGVPKV